MLLVIFIQLLLFINRIYQDPMLDETIASQVSFLMVNDHKKQIFTVL